MFSFPASSFFSFPHAPSFSSSPSFQVSTLRLKPQERVGLEFGTTEGVKSQSKGSKWSNGIK